MPRRFTAPIDAVILSCYVLHADDAFFDGASVAELDATPLLY